MAETFSVLTDFLNQTSLFWGEYRRLHLYSLVQKILAKLKIQMEIPNKSMHTVHNKNDHKC